MTLLSVRGWLVMTSLHGVAVQVPVFYHDVTARCCCTCSCLLSWRHCTMLLCMFLSSIMTSLHGVAVHVPVFYHDVIAPCCCACSCLLLWRHSMVLLYMFLSSVILPPVLTYTTPPSFVTVTWASGGSGSS